MKDPVSASTVALPRRAVAGWLTRWRVALRIARRDAWRARSRTVLVMVLIALPAFALGAVAVVNQSNHLDAGDTVARQLGRTAQGYVTAPSGTAAPITQSATAPGLIQAAHTELTPGQVETQIRALIPAADTVTASVTGPATIISRGRTVAVDLSDISYADPSVAGIVRTLTGRAPWSPREASLSSGLADHLGLGVGATVTTAGGRHYTVVGIVAVPDFARQVFLTPAAFDLAAAADPTAYRWYVAGPRPLAWALVQQLNRQGLFALSRQVVLHPPAGVPSPAAPGDARPGLADPVIAKLAILLAAVEIILLAGPAFAVGARRSARTLALVAAAGADRSQLRRITLASGVVIGVAAGLAGVIIGAAAGVLAVPLLRRAGVIDPVSVHLPVRTLTGVWLLAAVAAALAALGPAWQVSRQPVAMGLTRRRGQTPVRRSITAVSAGVFLLSAAGLLAAALRRHFLTAGIFGVLAELALIGVIGAVLNLTALAARRFPLGLRLASRDANRHRARTAPAIAAVLAATAGSVATLVYVASLDAHARQAYRPSVAVGTVTATLPDTPGQSTVDRAELPAVFTALRSSLPVRDVAVISQAFQTVAILDRPGSTCSTTLHPSVQHCGAPAAAITPPFTTWIDDGRGVSIVTGAPDPAVLSALAAGRVVVTHPDALWPDGTAHLRVTTYDAKTAGSTDRVEVVPAVLAALPLPAQTVVMSPLTAGALTIGSVPSFIAASTTRAPLPVELERAQTVLDQQPVPVAVQAEQGYRPYDVYKSTTLALLVVSAIATLGAAVVSVRLAAAEGVADMDTLTAVGAGPRTRRAIAVGQAAVITVPGGILGAVAGVVLASALVLARRYIGAVDPTWTVTLPWATLLTTVVVVPALAVAQVALFIHPTGRLTQRQTQ